MMSEIVGEIAFFVLGFGAGIIIMRRCNEKPKPITINESFYPALMGCRKCLEFKVVCDEDYCGTNKFRKFTSTLEMASKTIDICVCLISFKPIVMLIAKLSQKGIRVRIICDKSQMQHAKYGTESRAVFRKNNIELKEVHSDSLMHHKFAVIDSKLLINGSMNWTINGFFANYENLEITDKQEAVLSFDREFQTLWGLIA